MGAGVPGIPGLGGGHRPDVPEAAGWARPIRFAKGAGGHAPALEVAGQAVRHGVRRLVFAHIGRPTITALDTGPRGRAPVRPTMPIPPAADRWPGGLSRQAQPAATALTSAKSCGTGRCPGHRWSCQLGRAALPNRRYRAPFEDDQTHYPERTGGGSAALATAWAVAGRRSQLPGAAGAVQHAGDMPVAGGCACCWVTAGPPPGRDPDQVRRAGVETGTNSPTDRHEHGIAWWSGGEDHDRSG